MKRWLEYIGWGLILVLIGVGISIYLAHSDRIEIAWCQINCNGYNFI